MRQVPMFDGFDSIPHFNHHKVDPRYSETVQTFRDEAEEAVRALRSRGLRAALGHWSDGRWGCAAVRVPVAHGLAKFVTWRVGDPRVAPDGRWMGMPEKHWRIPRRRWEAMSVQAQAERECREQVEVYVPHQFEEAQRRFWMPRDYERWYWDEGGARQMEGAMRR